MTDSIDKNSKEKHLDVDLDAMLDEAGSSIFSANEFQDDDAAVDRLLMNDDPLQAEVDEDVGSPEALDDFSDFSDFDEPEMDLHDSPPTAVAEVGGSEPVAGNLSADDEVDDFFGLADSFDESDLIQDDEPEIPAPAVTELIAANEESPTVIDESDEDEDAVDALDDFIGLSDDFNGLEPTQDDEVEDLAGLAGQPSDDEDANDNSLLGADFDFEDALDETDGKEDELLDDDFDESDMIQNDEVDDWADLLAPTEEPKSADEESFNDLLGDENNFNSLPLDADFGAEDADLIENDDFLLDEVNDEFSTQIEETQSAETETLLAPADQEDDFLLPDFDITADTDIADVSSELGSKEDEKDTFGNIDFLSEDEAVNVFGPEAGGFDAVESKPEQASAPAAETVMKSIENVEDVKLSPFDFEQEDIKKLLDDAQNKVKRAKLFSYVAMGVAAVAMCAAVGLGVMTYGAKTEFSKLTEMVATLEANVAKSATNHADGSDISNIVVQQDMVSKELGMLQIKMDDLEDKVSLAPPIAEPAKVEATHEPVAAKAGNASESAQVKTAAAHEPSKDKAKAKNEKTPVKAEATPAKTEAAPVIASAPDKAATPPKAVTPKPVIAAKAVVKQEPVKEKKQTAQGKWGVNLGAFKQEWYAKSRAAEFAQQGVLAEVIPVQEKNTTMYRLRVVGYKTRAEADSNTARIKKALNLDSVWVSDN